MALAANIRKNGNILETNTSREFSFVHNVDGVWSNSTENLNLVGQVTKKLLMKDIIISKFPKLGESMGVSG